MPPKQNRKSRKTSVKFLANRFWNCRETIVVGQTLSLSLSLVLSQFLKQFRCTAIDIQRRRKKTIQLANVDPIELTYLLLVLGNNHFHRTKYAIDLVWVYLSSVVRIYCAVCHVLCGVSSARSRHVAIGPPTDQPIDLLNECDTPVRTAHVLNHL